MGARKAIVIAAVVLAAAAAGAVAWSGYTAQQTRVQREAVLKLLGDSTEQLREALARTPSAELLSRLEANAQAARSPRNRELADAVEAYIVSAREIARRRADAARISAEAAAGGQALTAHMGQRSRASNWYQNAVSLKTKVEQQHGDLGRTLKALEELLGGMPEAQKRLAPHAASNLLLEAGVSEAAIKQAKDEAQRAALELEKLRSLAPR